MNNKVEILITNIERVIVGKRKIIEYLICALLCDGHILIEDVPGVGKTQLIATLARSVNGKFNRIQLTPDIMPSDIVGFSMLNPQTRLFEYHEGVAMCNFLLADEINRASPKAQSSLLEIMEEHQISLDGETYPLPKPFVTLATQNPVETYGTYHLPEAQMDRFLMKIGMGYPTAEEELEIIKRSEMGNPLNRIDTVLKIEDIIDLQNEMKLVKTTDIVRKYMVDIISATRNNEYIQLGVSPRGSIALLKASKAYAFIKGRDYVIPDDVKMMADCVLSHRIILSSKGRAFGSSSEIIQKIVSETSVPISSEK